MNIFGGQGAEGKGVSMIFMKNYCLKGYNFFGILICGVLGSPAVDAKMLELKTEHAISVDSSVLTKSRHTPANGRDPFRPIIKPRPPSSASNKPRPKPAARPVVSKVKDPTWKLLGVIYGQSGRQAVIQVSPKERIIVGLGSEFPLLEWTVKAIHKGEVLLEHSSIDYSVAGSPIPRTFILSFPTSGKS